LRDPSALKISFRFNHELSAFSGASQEVLIPTDSASTVIVDVGVLFVLNQHQVRSAAAVLVRPFAISVDQIISPIARVQHRSH